MCKIYVKCSSCKEEKELSSEFFAKNITTPNGFTSMCKTCKSRYKYPEKYKEYYQKNKEEISKKSREKYLKLIQNNPKYCSEFYHKHKSKHIESRKAYYQSHKEIAAEYNKNYKRNNKKKFKLLNRKSMIKQRDLLSDSYIKNTIVAFAYNNGIQLSNNDITEDMIIIQRENIKLTRENNIEFLTL